MGGWSVRVGRSLSFDTQERTSQTSLRLRVAAEERRIERIRGRRRGIGGIELAERAGQVFGVGMACRKGIGLIFEMPIPTGGKRHEEQAENGHHQDERRNRDGRVSCDSPNAPVTSGGVI